MSKRNRYYRIGTHPESGSSFIIKPDHAIDILRSMMEDAPEREGYVVSVVYMPDEEHATLDEFTGF